MKNRKSLLFFKSAEEKIGPIALTSLQINGKPGINPGEVGICMTGKGKQAGQGDLQESHQVRRRSAGQNEYRFPVQHAKSDSLARTYTNPVKVLLPSKTFKHLRYQVTVTCPRSSACYNSICICRYVF